MQKEKFSSETELVSAFSEFLYKGGMPVEAKIAFEVETGYGIADLMLYSVKESHNQNLESFAKVPSRYAILLSESVKPNKFDFESFCNYIGTSENASKRVLNHFVRLGLIQPIGNGIFEIIKIRQCPIDRIISIEAKLANWKQALRQAYRHREFSNESWVVLDEHYAANALRNIELFIKANVGLAVFSKSGKLAIGHTPKTHDPVQNSKYWSTSVKLAQSYLLTKANY